ncbi:MAG: hypothetical protein ACKOXF_12070, partial [Chitinophagaceae bacterium]
NLIYQSNQKGMLGTIIRSFFNPLGVWLIFLMLFNGFRAWRGFQFFFSKHLSWQVRLIILAFPVYILIFTGPIGTSRFFMPLIPLAFLMFLLSGKQNTSQ